MKATIREISRQTGFSPATVSNALSGKRSVNAETSRQILKTAGELGYFETAPASRPKIRLVFFQADETIAYTSAFSSLIKGVEQESDRVGYEVTFHYLQRGSSSFVRQIKMLEETPQTAVVLVGNELTDEDFSCFESLSSPTVLIGYWRAGLRQSAVLPDFEMAASLTAGYLTAKGHQRIGHLQNRYHSTVTEMLEYWYKREFEHRNLMFGNSDTIPLDPGLESSYRSMLQYLEQKRALPSAFVADSDEIALGAMKALQEKGIRIPADVSVIGFGDLPFAQIVSPGLTTISFSHEEIGIQSVKILTSQISQPDASPMRVMVTPKLVKRGSVQDLHSLSESPA